MEIIIKNRNYRKASDFINDIIWELSYPEQTLHNEINTLQEELTLENSIEIYKKAKQYMKKYESKNTYKAALKYIENHIDNCNKNDKLKMISFYESLTMENAEEILDMLHDMKNYNDNMTILVAFVTLLLSAILFTVYIKVIH
jgi:hypothetical protein